MLIFFYLPLTEEATDKRIITALPLIQPLRPQGKTFHLFICFFIYLLSPFKFSKYFPNTMAMPPSSFDMKSAECCDSLASPRQAFTWHQKQLLQVTILSLWRWWANRLLKTVPSCQQCSGWGQLSHTDYSVWMRQLELRRSISSTFFKGVYIPHTFLCGVQGLIDYGVNIWQQTGDLQEYLWSWHPCDSKCVCLCVGVRARALINVLWGSHPRWLWRRHRTLWNDITEIVKLERHGSVRECAESS